MVMKWITRFYIWLILAVILSACGNAHPGNPTPVHLSATSIHVPGITPTPTAAVASGESSWAIGPASIGKGTIHDGIFSPDGKRFAAITPLGVYIYAVDTLEVLDFVAVEPPLLSAAFSSDWAIFATGKGQSVTVQRLADKQIITNITATNGIVSRLLFSPDGSLLATFVVPPGDEIYHYIVELWDVRSGKRLSAWNLSIYDSFSFAPDGKTFYSWGTSSQMTGARRWEIPSGKLLPALEGLEPYPQVFSPDLTVYAATTDDGVIVQRIASSSQAGRVIIHSSSTIKTLLFSPDSSLLLDWSMDGALSIWRAVNGSLLNTIDAGPPSAGFLAISPDNQTLAFPVMDGIAFYSLADGSVLRRLDDHLTTIEDAVISPDGTRVAVLLEGGGVMVWDLSSMRPLYSLPDINAISLAWSPDGNWLVSSGWDKNLHLLRAGDGATAQNIPAHAEQIQSVAFSPNSDRLASSSMELVKMWQIQDGAILRGSPDFSKEQTFSAPGGWVTKVRFSPDGRYLAAISADGKVFVWPSDNTRPLAVISVPGMAGDRNIMDFSPDGSILAVGEAMQIGLWRIPEAEPFKTLPLGGETLIAFRISPDGRLLASGLADGNILLWQIPAGKLLQTLRGGSEGISSLDFSADGLLLLSASRDGTIHTWNIKQQGLR